MAEYIYTMHKARKAHGDKLILDDVSMSFFPGAKIGVVGPNGAGKSTILKIMAGLDQPSNGEARLSPGYTVGILLQEPELDPSKDVIGNVRDGLGDLKVKLDRFNEIGELMGRPDADFDALLAEMGDLQADLDHAEAWDLDSQLEQAMDALRCPPPEVRSGGSRCASCCSASPTCCCSMSPPTTSTPSRCSGWSSTWLSTRVPCSR
jgi:ATPase subunit of ABC transporter with duplicated ATPase domains